MISRITRGDGMWYVFNVSYTKKAIGTELGWFRLLDAEPTFLN